MKAVETRIIFFFNILSWDMMLQYKLPGKHSKNSEIGIYQLIVKIEYMKRCWQRFKHECLFRRFRSETRCVDWLSFFFFFFFVLANNEVFFFLKKKFGFWHYQRLAEKARIGTQHFGAPFRGVKKSHEQKGKAHFLSRCAALRCLAHCKRVPRFANLVITVS